MSTETKLTVNRVLQIGEAVQSVGENIHLDGKVAYAIGRLGDQCKSIITSFEKGRSNILRKQRDEVKPLQRELKSASSEERKIELKELIQESIDGANEQFEKLGETEESIKIPKLTLTSFIAKDDIPHSTQEKILVKKNQSLVPVKFFTLMGELVVDDSQ